ncbi:MAG: T9SS type A sorting domain-containing protein, partial [Saprospiraceae bacterium]|nr:T9SS type A sorting domain-containing protein [Saprospiraceae bacterium]
YLAKIFEVDRVLMFAGPNDYSNLFAAPAPWLAAPSATPLKNYFGYLSQLDEIVDFSKQYQNLVALGLSGAGDTTLVDNGAPPYGNSHFLYTRQSPGFALLHHNTPIKLGTINNKVWTYMLTSAVTSSTNTPNHNFHFTVFPNPTTGSLVININQEQKSREVILQNALGYPLEKWTVDLQTNEFSFDICKFPPGVYFLSIEGTILKIIKQ